MKKLQPFYEFTKKWFLILILLFSFVISIFLSTKRQDDIVELHVWEYGSGSSPWDHGIVKVNRIFEERHPGVKIVTPPMAGSSYTQKLMSAIVGDAAPDVAGAFGEKSYIAEWAGRGALLALDDFIKRDKGQPNALNPDDWVPGAHEAVTFQGKIYGVPTSTVAAALYYNEDALISARFVNKSGKPRLPKTMDEYLKFCKQYAIRDEKGIIKRLGSLMGYHHMMRIYRMGLLFGGEFFSEDGRQATFTHPQIVKALEFMLDYSDYLGGPGKFKTFTTGDWREGTGGGDKGLFSGQLGTLMHGQFYMTNIVYNAPDINFGITDLPQPADVPKTNLVLGYSLAIPKNAKHPELAYQYLKWILSPEAQLIAAEEMLRITKSRGIPFTPFTTGIRTIDSLLYTKIVKDNPDYKLKTRQIYKIFLDKLENSKSGDPVASPMGFRVMTELDRAHDLAMFHEKTPYEALKTAEKVIQRELDEFYSGAAYSPVNWRQISIILVVLFGIFLVFLIWWVYRLRLSQIALRDFGCGVISVSPWIIGFVVFLLGPIIFSIIFSFTRYSGLSDARWVGFKNYYDLLFNDPLFWKALKNTGYMLLAVPLNMVLGLGIALLLNMKVRGVNFYRTIYYLPSIIPFVATSILWIWILDPTNGILNILLGHIGIQGPAWLGDANWTKPAVIIMGLWTAGGSMIIWLAGLKGIPNQFYESAEVDGANWWRKFLHITIPMLTPYIFFNLIMGIIGTLQIFAQAMILGSAGTQPTGTLDSLLFYVFYLFNTAFVDFKMGYASAMAWILFIIILILTIFQLKMAPKWVYYEGKTK